MEIQKMMYLGKQAKKSIEEITEIHIWVFDDF
jgi:hypothetical protein